MRIIMRSPDGFLRIIVPKIGGTDEEHIAHARKVDPTMVDCVHVETTTADALPDRKFRNAWRHDGKALSIHMPTAREIHKQRLRELRTPLMKSADIEVIRAIEDGNQESLTALRIKKQALRDVTADPAIEKATTPEELLAIVPKILSGQ